MTTSYASDLEQIVQTIFATMAGTDVQPGGEAVDPQEERIVGTIQISGAWTGCVLLQAPCSVARAVTASFLSMTPDDVGEADVRDVTAELTNMIGGNFKSVLPGPCSLSLPNVVTGREYDIHVPSAAEIESLTFSTPCGPLSVHVYVKTA